jgi:hypothetical protein
MDHPTDALRKKWQYPGADLNAADIVRILAEIEQSAASARIGALITTTNFDEFLKEIKVRPLTLSDQLANAMNALKENMHQIQQSNAQAIAKLSATLANIRLHGVTHAEAMATISARLVNSGQINATLGEAKLVATGTVGPPPPPRPVIDVGVFTEEQALSRIEVVSGIAADVIAGIGKDPHELCKLSPGKFEDLIMELLAAMGNEVEKAGPTNQPDAFVDIVFWSKVGVPILGAVQVKHHDSIKVKTGIDAIQRMEGVLSKRRQEFNLGMVVTNTSFTEDAKWQAKDSGIYLRLRDGADIDRWVKGDFNNEEERREFPGKIQLTRHLAIDVKKKLLS